MEALVTDGAQGEAVPAPAETKASRTNNALAIAGWITALVFWPAGLVLGGILASRDDKRGRWIAGIAVAIGLIWIVAFLVIQNAAEEQAARSYYYE
jgi:hypothetical protein